MVKELVYTRNFCLNEDGNASKNHSLFTLGGQKAINKRLQKSAPLTLLCVKLLEKLVEKAGSQAPPRNSGPGICISKEHPRSADRSVMLLVHIE